MQFHVWRCNNAFNHTGLLVSHDSKEHFLSHSEVPASLVVLCRLRVGTLDVSNKW